MIKNVNLTNPNIIIGLVKKTPFEVLLNVLIKVDDSTVIIGIIQSETIVNKVKKTSTN